MTKEQLKFLAEWLFLSLALSILIHYSCITNHFSTCYSCYVMAIILYCVLAFIFPIFFLISGKRDYFVIMNKFDQEEILYWNNEDGWGDYKSATIFKKKELEWINLPMDADTLLYLNLFKEPLHEKRLDIHRIT